MKKSTEPRDAQPDLRPTVFDALRTERWIALIRIAVIGVVIAVYLASEPGEHFPAPLVEAILALALVYAIWSLVAFSGPAEPSSTARLLSVFVDTTLVTAWLVLVHGALSDYWALYIIVVIASAMRFDLVQTMATAAGLAVLYGTLAIADRVPRELVIQRTSLVVISGFAVGVLSQQRLVHRRRGQVLEAEARQRACELSEERAEVERLKRVDMAKSEFVAVAAHEFRTPLAAVIGVLSTLREHGDVLAPQERLELLDGASSQANRLARLVDDLLTVARIEDGVLRLSLESVEPRHLLSEAAQVSGMTGRLVMQVGRVEPVHCDQDAIIRVLTNLLDNARKYSPPGSKVHISVSREGEMVRFQVTDEGPGIPEDEQVQIFERFRRLDGGKAKPGAGLGLYICRGLVEAHGGTIRAGNGPGGGAEFSFTLPRAVKGDKAGAPAPPEVRTELPDEPVSELTPRVELEAAAVAVELPPAAAG